MDRLSKSSSKESHSRKKNFLFDKTMGRLMRKIRKLGNRRKRSRSETTGRDCAKCTALITKVDGELFLAAR